MPTLSDPRPRTWAKFEEAFPSEAWAIDRAFAFYYADELTDDLSTAKTDTDRLAKFIAWQAMLKGWRAVEMRKAMND
jgi:hypothetical protein